MKAFFERGLSGADGFSGLFFRKIRSLRLIRRISVHDLFFLSFQTISKNKNANRNQNSKNTLNDWKKEMK
jgi:hypothetical protein